MEKIRCVLATLGVTIKVSPFDDIQFQFSDNEHGFIDDWSPFCFRVAGELLDDGYFFGLFGPIVSGHERYHGLICSITLRVLPCEWHSVSECSANFKVGPARILRNDNFEFSEPSDLPHWCFHPDATKVQGYPKFSRMADIVVAEPERGTEF